MKDLRTWNIGMKLPKLHLSEISAYCIRVQNKNAQAHQNTQNPLWL